MSFLPHTQSQINFFLEFFLWKDLDLPIARVGGENVEINIYNCQLPMRLCTHILQYTTL